MSIKVAITDDHLMVLNGLKGMLDGQSGIEICDLYSTGEELLAGLIVRQPDVLLLDIQLPDKTGN